MQELFYAGIEGNKKLFKRFDCWYVGVQYGDWEKLSWKLEWKIVKNKKETTK
jgi:hypothetical protein